MKQASLACGCAILALGSALGGCVSDHNARLELGSNVVIDRVSERSHGVDDDAPSVHGLDRSNWESISVRVPVDGTVHRPTYARTRLYDESLARQKGLYPTSETALELEGASGLAAAEIAAQPFHVFVGAALVPLRVAMDPPWERAQSPRTVYKRRAPGGWLTGGAAPVEPVGTLSDEPAETAIEEVEPDA